jgi:hypothetical protein
MKNFTEPPQPRRFTLRLLGDCKCKNQNINVALVCNIDFAPSLTNKSTLHKTDFMIKSLITKMIYDR